MEPPKSLETKGKTLKKTLGNRKGKKARTSKKKQGLEGQGVSDLFWPSVWAIPPVRLGLSGRKFRKNSGKTPETLSERFLEFPLRVRLGCPKPYHSRHLRLPERFQNSLPPQYGWGRLFFQNRFRRGPLRAGHGIPSSTGGISESLMAGNSVSVIGF